jgi:hypothetical protein
MSCSEDGDEARSDVTEAIASVYHVRSAVVPAFQTVMTSRRAVMKSLVVMLLLAGIFPGSSAAQIFEYGPAQLARQAVDIRAPYLAQMAQIRYGAALSNPGTARSPVRTSFKRSRSWFKPWSMANEISKSIEWDPKAPFGTGFAREEAQRQALTTLFTACLETYEEQAKAEGLATDDLAVTYGHTIALNWELATGNKMSASEEAALRRKLHNEFAGSPYYWTDADKQSVHETIVITTMLALAGNANATRDNDQRSQAMFRDAGRKNVTALTNATLIELRNARSTLSQK